MDTEKQKHQSEVFEKRDLTNEDVVTQILETGNDEELEELRKFHKLTPEKIKLFRDCAKLRKEVHEQMRRELDQRIKQNPAATEEELNIGAYQESIEPQVRNAVLNLRRKGYTTYESGFYGYTTQRIGFEENHFDPDELINRIRIEGVDIKIKPRSISFSYDRYLELDEIKQIWNQIEEALPGLGKSVEPCNLNQAKSFRRKQKD